MALPPLQDERDGKREKEKEKQLTYMNLQTKVIYNPSTVERNCVLGWFPSLIYSSNPQETSEELLMHLQAGAVGNSLLCSSFWGRMAALSGGLVLVLVTGMSCVRKGMQC